MYRKETREFLKHLDFILLDLLCLQIGFILSYRTTGRAQSVLPYQVDIYRDIAIILALLDYVVMLSYQTFQGVMHRENGKEFAVTFKHSVLVFGACTFYLFVMKTSANYSRVIVFMTLVYYMVISYLVRIGWKAVLRRRSVNAGGQNLLVIATREEIERVVKDIQENTYGRFTIAGLVVLDENMEGKTLAGCQVVAGIQDAAMYVCKHWIDEVFVVAPQRTGYPEELMEELMMTGVTVHLSLAKVKNNAGSQQMVESIGGYTVLTTSMNNATTVQLLLKRGLDIVGGLVGCAITAVLFVFLAPIIYKNSPGPIFFKQERIGKNGKKFQMYKFRSMYMDAEARKAELMAKNRIGDAKMFKLDFDPRVIGNEILPDGTKKTGIGQFIRDYSLDEFPQFFNVLMGSMSLVGFRPALEGEVNLYDLHHRSRLAIKPGITGMWQTSGRSDITDFEEVVRLDREYINNWSIGLDLKILLKTVLVVFKKEGSM